MFPVNVRLLSDAIYDTSSSYTVATCSVTFELSAPCQSNVGVTHYKCSGHVVMEGTVN